MRLDPKNARAYHNRGIAWITLGHSETAIRDFTEAIRLVPGYAIAYVNRALAYDLLGQKAEAEADLAKARQLGYTPRPQNPGRAYAFQSCLIHAFAPHSSGSPESRTRRLRGYQPCSGNRPSATICQRRNPSGRDGGTRTRGFVRPRHAGCHCPTSRQSVRTGGFEPPISWSPTRRDARLRYVLPQVARAGVEPASTP